MPVERATAKIAVNRSYVVEVDCSKSSDIIYGPIQKYNSLIKSASKNIFSLWLCFYKWLSEAMRQKVICDS